MNRKHVIRHKHGERTTRSARSRRDWLLRAGVWAFIIVFAFSVIGGLMIISQIGVGSGSPTTTNTVQIPGNTYLPNAGITPLPAHSHHP